MENNTRSQFGSHYRASSQPQRSGSAACNFCGRNLDHETAMLVASPARMGPLVYICDECIEACMGIVCEEFRSAVSQGYRVGVAPAMPEPEPAPGSGAAPKSSSPDSPADPENQATSIASGGAAKITRLGPPEGV
jgi:hypothetical protein